MRRVVVAVAVVAVGGVVAAFLVGRATPAPRNVDVSQAPRPQEEVSAAIDPRDPEILLAGSNSWQERRLRAYSSTDGGRSWQSQIAPQIPQAATYAPAIPPGDPAVGIDLRGRQYYAFLAYAGPQAEVFVAVRPGGNGAWETLQGTLDTPIVARTPPPYAGDDKPALAVDVGRTSPHVGRVYVAWERRLVWPGTSRVRSSLMVTHSDDGGRTWSAPATAASATRLADCTCGPFAAVAGDGTLYATWTTLTGNVFVTRSRDGVHFDPPHLVAARPLRLPAPCRPAPQHHLPATPTHRSPIGWPSIVTDDARHRVDVVYVRVGCNGAVDTWLTSFDPSLRTREIVRRVNPPDGAVPSDQFQPTAAYDRTTHDLWVCYYDTRPDPSRRSTRFTCTVSHDGGRRFERPRPATSARSDETGPDAAHFSIPDRHAAQVFPAGNEYGDFESVVAADGVAHPFWTDSRDLATRAEEIYTTALRAR